MTQGTPFRFVRDAALTTRPGTPFRFVRDAALTTRPGTPFRFVRGSPIVTGIRSKQFGASAFTADTPGRALFGAGLFNLATDIFNTGSIATSKLAATFIKADGTVPMVSSLDVGSNKVTGLVDGTLPTDIATKGQLDSAIAGIAWKDPVAVKELIGSSTIAGINGLSPTLGDSYVATDAGTPTAGTSDTLVAGSIAEFDGTSWIEVVAGSGGFPIAGTRALASLQTALNGTIGLTESTDDGKILQWDGTSLTPALIVPLDGDTLLVSGNGGSFENLSYSYSGVSPTGTWDSFAGAITSTAGAGLTVIGNSYAVGDANKGVQVNADTLEIASSEIVAVSGGLKTGANSWQLAIEPAEFAGVGLEDDGADNLRLSTQGNGIAGGAGTALSVASDTTGGAGSGVVAGSDIAPITVSANGVGVDVTRLDGDHLDITFTPANYTPDAAIAEAADVNDLAAHLKGIDTFISTLGGVPRQEVLVTEFITGTDTTIGDTLGNTPASALAVELYLNGILQGQGAGLDYTISGTAITWLASSGTAVNMDTSDTLVAIYES